MDKDTEKTFKRILDILEKQAKNTENLKALVDIITSQQLAMAAIIVEKNNG